MARRGHFLRPQRSTFARPRPAFPCPKMERDGWVGQKHTATGPGEGTRSGRTAIGRRGIPGGPRRETDAPRASNHSDDAHSQAVEGGNRWINQLEFTSTARPTEKKKSQRTQKEFAVRFHFVCMNFTKQFLEKCAAGCKQERGAQLEQVATVNCPVVRSCCAALGISLVSQRNAVPRNLNKNNRGTKFERVKRPKWKPLSLFLGTHRHCALPSSLLVCCRSPT